MKFDLEAYLQVDKDKRMAFIVNWFMDELGSLGEWLKVSCLNESELEEIGRHLFLAYTIAVSFNAKMNKLPLVALVEMISEGYDLDEKCTK